MIIDWRSREDAKKYKEFRAHASGCPFCEIDQDLNKIIEENSTMRVIANAFRYEIWDNCVVLDHLMITPKRHTDSLGDFNFDESVDYVELLEKYDKLGYSVYGRASTNKHKSVQHQHTHLFKLGAKVEIEKHLDDHLR